MREGQTSEDDVLVTSMDFDKADDLMSYIEECCNEINR
jgi:hypothetical protein